MAVFEKIFEENRDFVFRYLLKLCHSADVADELTQETFFRAYINFAGIRNKDRCTTWLCQTAKNCWFAWYNSQKRFTALDDETVSVSDPAETVAQQELSEMAADALDSLEEPYRQVFRLAALAETPLKEISRMYGKSESWARVTYYRAKQMLKERMGKNEL